MDVNVSNSALSRIVAALVILPAMTPADPVSCNVLGEVFAADPFDSKMQIKTDRSGNIQTISFSGETQFARTNVSSTDQSEFDPKRVQVGDRICATLRTPGASESLSGTAEIAVRVVVMQRTDIQEQQKRVLAAFALNTASGIIRELNNTKKTITIDETEVGGTPQTITVDASSVTVLHRWFAPDAHTIKDVTASGWQQLQVGGHIFVEGERNVASHAIQAAVIISGDARGMVGTVVNINGQGQIDLQDLRSGLPVTAEVRIGSVFRISPFIERTSSERTSSERTSSQQTSSEETASKEITNNQTLGQGETHHQTATWNLSPIGIADLQKGDTVSVLGSARGDPRKITGLMVVTGFGSFGTDQPPLDTSVLWTLDPLKPPK